MIADMPVPHDNILLIDCEKIDYLVYPCKTYGMLIKVTKIFDSVKLCGAMFCCSCVVDP